MQNEGKSAAVVLTIPQKREKFGTHGNNGHRSQMNDLVATDPAKNDVSQLALDRQQYSHYSGRIARCAYAALCWWA